MKLTLVMLLQVLDGTEQGLPLRSSTWEMPSYIREKLSSMFVNPACLQTSQIYYQCFDCFVCIINTPTVTQVEFLTFTTLSESELDVNFDLITLQVMLSTGFFSAMFPFLLHLSFTLNY